MTKLSNWQSFLLIFYLSTLLSLVALFVVVMTTCGATSDDRVAKLTTFLCLMDDVLFLNVMIYRWCVYREFSATRYGLVMVNIISERIFVKIGNHKNTLQWQLFCQDVHINIAVATEFVICCMSATRLFVESFVEANISPRCWPLMRGIHQSPMLYAYKRPITREAFPCHDVIMCSYEYMHASREHRQW